MVLFSHISFNNVFMYKAEDIIKIRQDYKLTQEELADRLGLSREIVVKMETGRRTISKSTQILLHNFLSENNSENNSVKSTIKKHKNMETNENDRTEELISTLKDQIAWLKSSRDEKNVYIEELREKIKDLQQNLKDVRSHNETLKHEVLLNLETVLGNQIVQEAAMEARQDTILEELLKGKPFEERLRVYETVDKRVLELGSEYDGKDMHLKTGSLYRKLT